MLKRSLSIILAIIFMIGVSGCMFNSKEAEILEHLEQKYGVEFVSIGFDLSNSNMLHCYPKGGDPDADAVKAVKTVYDSGEVEFSDTYFGIIIREDLESEVLEVLSDMEFPVKVFYHHGTDYFASFSPDDTKTYVDLKQWLAEGNKYKFDVSVYVLLENIEIGEEYAEHYANEIFNRLKKLEIQLFVDVRVFTQHDIYQTITRNNQFDIVKSDGMFVFSEKIN